MITRERIADYIDSMGSELPPLLQAMEEEALCDDVPIIKRPAREVIRHMIRLTKPGHVLEVGTAVGFSAVYMSEYLPDGGDITTIEKMPERIAKARENFKRAGLENKITLLEGDAGDFLPALVKENKVYDLIFMDAAKGQYLTFLEDIGKLLANGGLLISDNVLQDGEIIESHYVVPRRERTIHARMREYLFRLTHTENWDTVILPLGDGVALTYKMEENPEIDKRR